MLIRRTALGALGVTALVAGGLAPATASATQHDEDSGEVTVKVCKKVERGNYHDYHGKRFNFSLQTDEESKDFKLKHGYCKTQYLDYEDGELVLHEKHAHNYDVRFHVWGEDVEHAERHGNKLYVSFDEHAHEPFVWIKVINKKQHH